MESANQIPLYRSHKLVRGFKIASIDPSEDGGARLQSVEDFGPRSLPLIVNVSKAYRDKHDPQPGGYYCLYEDGYESWSPADAFEGGNTKVDVRAPRSMDEDEIREVFRHHVPTESQRRKFESIRATMIEATVYIAALCPASIERSLFLTRMREAQTWANACIAIRGGREDQG